MFEGTPSALLSDQRHEPYTATCKNDTNHMPSGYRWIIVILKKNCSLFRQGRSIHHSGRIRDYQFPDSFFCKFLDPSHIAAADPDDGIDHSSQFLFEKKILKDVTKRREHTRIARVFF